MKTIIPNRNICRTLLNEHELRIDPASEKKTSSVSRKIRAIAMIGAMLSVIFISGCASTPAGGGADTVNYNSDTDYSQLRYANHL